MADNSPKKWFALEEGFFSAVDQQLLEKLRQQASSEERAAAIQRITGLADSKVCQEIAAMNISVESLAALRLVPLVAVAWADDRIEENERFRVMQAAEKSGLVPGEPSYDLLHGWLKDRPPVALFDTWIEYAKALAQQLDGESRDSFRSALVAQVREVAEACGGLLGFGSISPTEKKILEQIENALR